MSVISEPLWVFGYGSLLWNPGFQVAEAVVARVDGFHRSFCMRSIHHRGAPDAPGLVLALDAAKTYCDGVAFRAADRSRALAYLRERELVSAAYLEQWHKARLRDGRSVQAVCYVIDRDHPQYCALSLEEQAQIIARAVGGRGRNSDYLLNTVAKLDELALPDADLSWLDRRVRELLFTTKLGEGRSCG